MFQEDLVDPSCQQSQAPFSLPHSNISSIPPALLHQRHFPCRTHLSPLLPHQTFACRPKGPRGLYGSCTDSLFPDTFPDSSLVIHNTDLCACLLSPLCHQPPTIFLPPTFAAPKAKVGREGEHSLLLTPHLHLSHISTSPFKPSVKMSFLPETNCPAFSLQKDSNEFGE